MEPQTAPHPARTRPIVFLHIPKTAGQTVHHQIGGRVGLRNISPIRDIVEAAPGQTHLPPGYAFYSGHIDWTDLDTLPDPFAFTILRDPRERIGSFYFYLLRQANERTEEELALPRFTGQRTILRRSADDYFFGGDRGWQRFIRNNYDNFYCAYLATRKIRGSPQMDGLELSDRVRAAREGARRLSAIYTIDRLADLETDIQALLGEPVRLVGNYRNVGHDGSGTTRWADLLSRFETDAAAHRLEQFVAADEALMTELA